MNAIQEIKDENVRKVAMTLRSSGLASSETEAVRMAMMMTKTSQKVNQNFDEKNKLSHSNPFQAPQPLKQETKHTDVFYSVQKSSSVQEKPRKTEEKEEFIFGDVQEKESVQKKDIYHVDNEFEEVVVQEVIITKPAPQMPKLEVPKQSEPAKTFNGRPSMFGGNTAPKPAAQVQQQTIRPVHTEITHSQQMPVHQPVSNPSPTPVTAASSAQMAFASLLGSAQAQMKEHEQKPAVQSSPAQASHSQPAKEPQQIHTEAPQASSCPRPIAHTPDPRANMMKEANVDLSKMFNVNK